MYFRKNKFKAKRTNGFASKLESAVHDILKFRELAKEITNIRCQHTVELTDAMIKYRVDFSYDENGETIFVEAKGHPTDTWLLKKKLWRYYGPGKLEIWTGSYKNPTLSEVIIPKS